MNQSENKQDHYATCNGCGIGMTESEITFQNDEGHDYCLDCYDAIQSDDESSGRLADRENIIRQMVDIMPFTIAPEVWNYINEAMIIYAQQRTDHAISVIKNRIAELEEELSTCTHDSVKAELKIEIGGLKYILTLLQS